MPAKILDEFTFMNVSRQRRLQLRRQREGLCIICATPLDGPSKQRCWKHMVANRERERKRIGAKARYFSRPSYRGEHNATRD